MLPWQGCFGYRKRQDLESIVSSYRRHKIPLDGLAVDVDVQHRYKTFTIDEAKFPDPQGMFAGLREKGVKCCTNITPIISKEDTAGYNTYNEARENGFFIIDERHDPNSNDSRSAQFYQGGQSKKVPFMDWDGESKNNYNSRQPYIGKVWYGGLQMTTGHYPDLARREVRDWWGQQYKHLFDQGLEFVWQDMTTPAIPVFEDRVPYGDMKGFPFRLMVTDNFLSGRGGSCAADFDSKGAPCCVQASDCTLVKSLHTAVASQFAHKVAANADVLHRGHF